MVIDSHRVSQYKVRALYPKDIKRFKSNRDSAKYRILVSGSRGKSGLVEDIYSILYERGFDVLGKITGANPKIFHNGWVYNIDRGSNPRRFFLDHENAGIIADFKADIYCFENQTISKYTNGYIHWLFKPHIDIIPNLRLEHAELGESIEELAHTFGRTLKGVDYAIFAEPLPKNRNKAEPILREYAIKYGVELRSVSIPSDLRSTPGIERLYIIQELLDIMGLPPLSMSEYNEIINRVLWELRPKISRYGWNYVDLSKVNDPDSTELALDYIRKNFVFDRPIYLISYFRGDRVDRTKYFLPFFKKVADDDKIVKVMLGGRYYHRVKKILGDKAVEMSKMSLEEYFREITREDGFLILTVNGITFEMEIVRNMLIPIEQNL